MSGDETPKFEFADLPLNPIDPGTTLVLAGQDSAASGVAKALGHQMLGNPSQVPEGAVYVSTVDSVESALVTLDEFLSRPMLLQTAIVPCSPTSTIPDVPFDYFDWESDHEIEGPHDIENIFRSYFAKHGALIDDGNVRCRTLIDSVSDLAIHSSWRVLDRIAHPFRKHIRQTNGLAMLTVDSSAHDAADIESYAIHFDGIVEVRLDGDQPQLRVTGLPNQPTEWVDF